MAEVERVIPEADGHILVKSFYVGNSTDYLHFGLAGVRVMDRINQKDDTDYINEVEKQCRTLENLVADGFVSQVLDLLSSHISQPGVSWEQIIMYYVYIFRRPSASKKEKSVAYQYFLKLIQNSKRLFFFLKMTSNFNFVENSTLKKKPHFGNGLKKAIIKWYLSKPISELLLDLWLMPRVYTWTHKDVLKLLHWNIDILPDEHLEHKIFVQYCMVRDYKKGKQEFLDTYTNLPEVKSLFDLIRQKMTKEPNDGDRYSLLQAVKELAEDDKYPLRKNCDQIIRQENLQVLIENLKDDSVYFICGESFLIHAINTKGFVSEEEKEEKENITRCLIEALDRVKDRSKVSAVDILIMKNAFIKTLKVQCDGKTDKKKWLGGEAFPSIKTPEAVRTLVREDNYPLSPPLKVGTFSFPLMEDLTDQLKENIIHQAKKFSIASDNPGLIVVSNMTPRMKNYIPTYPGLIVKKQMKGVHAILLMLYSFCYKATDALNDGLKDRALVITDGTHTTPYVPFTKPNVFKHCMTLFNHMKKPYNLKLNECMRSLFINWTTRSDDVNSVILIVEQVTQEIMTSCRIELAKEPNKKIRRFVLLGMYRSQDCENMQSASSSQLLIFNGFHSRIISIIRAYIEGQY